MIEPAETCLNIVEGQERQQKRDLLDTGTALFRLARQQQPYQLVSTSGAASDFVFTPVEKIFGGVFTRKAREKRMIHILNLVIVVIVFLLYSYSISTFSFLLLLSFRRIGIVKKIYSNQPYKPNHT